MKPTQETYEELQKAYDFFNRALFQSQLPDCLITLQREKRTFGYYSSERFVNRAKQRTDEIAMNPTYFSIRTIEETLSTLVHEMVHLWQCHFGKPGRGRYHNKEWAEKMMAVGLMPSSTGVAGGKATGDCMSHYILDGRLFERACKNLLTKNFRISWADRFPPRPKVPSVIEGTNEEGEESIIGTLSGWDIEADELPVAKKATRTKYTCSQCDLNVWGKASLNLRCDDCDLALEAVEC